MLCDALQDVDEVGVDVDVVQPAGHDQRLASVASAMAHTGILTDRPGVVRHELRSSGRELARQHRLHESQVGTRGIS